jgi:hypothetical protein
MYDDIIEPVYVGRRKSSINKIHPNCKSIEQRLKYDVFNQLSVPDWLDEVKNTKRRMSPPRQQLLQEYSEKHTSNLSVLVRHEHTVETAAIIN